MKNGRMIRKAEREDVWQIAEILAEDWKTAYRGIMDDDYLDSLSVDKRYEIEMNRYQNDIAAADANMILGYAWLQIKEDETADCEIVALYVRYADRNHGIGKRLLQYAVNHFKELGKKRMII